MNGTRFVMCTHITHLKGAIVTNIKISTLQLFFVINTHLVQVVADKRSLSKCLNENTRHVYAWTMLLRWPLRPVLLLFYHYLISEFWLVFLNFPNHLINNTLLVILRCLFFNKLGSKIYWNKLFFLKMWFFVGDGGVLSSC